MGELDKVEALGFARDVIWSVLRNRTQTFSGAGLIFYESPLRLPVIALSQEASAPKLSSAADFARFLIAAGDIRSPIHDGFHLVDAETLQITNSGQFFAPTISIGSPRIPIHHTGARTMAAFLGSLMESVVLTAVVGSIGSGHIFLGGKSLTVGDDK